MGAFPTVGLPDDDTVPLVTAAPAQVLADKRLRAARCLLSKQPPQQTNNEDVLT
jgi:hypothetical protein